MRPLKLTMECFGPFVAETVDFTSLGDELFLISGPTGSGKTTIFDGICYALYGEASSPDRLADGMKSDFADIGKPCQVDLTFAVGSKTYHIHRLPHQIMMNRLQTGHKEQKHEAQLWQVDDDGGEHLIAGSVRECAQKVQAILGLSASQFRQIVMLPQGEFSRLLKSTEKERVDLLKTLFSMSYYKAFEKKVESAARDADTEADRLGLAIKREILHFAYDDPSPLKDIVTGGDTTLEYLLAQVEEHIQKEQARAASLGRELKHLNARQQALARELGAGEALLKRFDQRDAFQKEVAVLSQRKQAMADLQVQAENARKAQLILPVEDSLRRDQKRQAQAQAALEARTRDAREAEAENAALAPMLARVESPAFEDALEGAQGKKKDLSATLANLDDLTAHEAKAADLRAQLAGMQERLDKVAALKDAQEADTRAMTALQRALAENQTALIDLTEQITHARENAATLKRVQEYLAVIEDNNQALLKLEGERAAIQEERDQWEARRVDLETDQLENAAGALAATLEELQPCPVCGSAQHPHPARAAHPLGTLSAALSKARSKASELTGTLTVMNERAAFCQGQIETTQEDIRSLIGNAPDFANAEPTPATVRQLTLFWQQKLDSLKEEREQQSAAIAARKKEQAERQAAWEANEQLIAQSERLRSRHQTLKSELDTLGGAISILKKRLVAVTADYPQAPHDPGSLHSIISREMAACDTAIAGMQKERRDIRERKETTTKRLAAARAAAESAAKVASEAGSSATHRQREYEDALKRAQLTEACYNAHKAFDLAVLAAWEEQLVQYDKDVAIATRTLSSLEAELTGKDRPDLTEQQEEMQQCVDGLNAIRDQYQKLTSQNATNNRQVERLRDLSGQMEQIKARQGLMQDLNHTIKGTVPGCQKLSFERYILSAYLQDILVSANLFLDDISDGRYHLMLADDPEQKDNRGLNIEVYDDFTGKSRAASSLSGGETFMAALSMALGLSDMVQAQAGGISLDTLFIDEGFATLDTNSLDKAMDCLSRLQRGGRIVGIISHVSELKDRIDAKILVEKTEAGSYIQVVPR